MASISQNAADCLSDNWQFKDSLSPENQKPPHTNRRLLLESPPIVSTRSDTSLLGFRQSTGFELTIDWLSATATKRLAPQDFEQLLRIFSGIPGNKLHPVSCGYGSGYARYSSSYKSVAGGVFAYERIGGSRKFTDISNIKSGEFFDDPPVQITWKSINFPTLKASNIPPLKLVQSGIIKVHSKTNEYSIIVPASWILDASDELELEVIENKLGINFNVDSGTIPQFKVGSCNVRFHYEDNLISIISEENLLTEADISTYKMKFELPGSFLRTLTLNQVLDVLLILKQNDFKLTRLDARLRDWSRSFEPQDLFQYAITGHIARVRKFSAPLTDYEIESDGSIYMQSPTIYLGSRKSTIFGRCYCEKTEHSSNSVAYESVLRDEKAQSLAEDLLSLKTDDITMQSLKKRLLDGAFAAFAFTEKPIGIIKKLSEIDEKAKPGEFFIIRNPDYNSKCLHPQWQAFIDKVYSYFSSEQCNNIQPLKIQGYRGGYKQHKSFIDNPNEAFQRQLNFHLRISKSLHKLKKSMTPRQWDWFQQLQEKIGSGSHEKSLNLQYDNAVLSHNKKRTKDYMTLMFLDESYRHHYSLEKTQNQLAVIEDDFDKQNHKSVGVKFTSSSSEAMYDIGKNDDIVCMEDYYHLIETPDDYIAIKEYLHDVRVGKTEPFSL